VPNRFHPLFQVEDELVEDNWVHILAQLHQNEPVAEPESVHHDRDINTAGTFSAAAEDEEATVSGKDSGCSERKEDAGPDNKQEKPEPKENIDLLVDNVDREDAEAVVVDNSSRGPILMKGALGHFGEDPCHRVCSFFDVLSSQPHHLEAISCKLAIEEDVHQPHLAKHVHQVQQLAENELVDVNVVAAQIVYHISDNLGPFLLGALHPFQAHLVKTLQKKKKLSTLPVLPQSVRDIAESSLEDEDEGDPLIPGVADLVPIFRDRNQVWVVHPGVRRNSRVSKISPLATGELGRESEGAVYPAISREDALLKLLLVNDAVNRISKVLLQSREERCKGEQRKRELVMKSEGGVVDEAFLEKYR